MTQLWMDGFDHYGDVIANMLDGAWAQEVGAGVDLIAPSVGARTGSSCLRLSSGSNDNYMRRILPAAQTELFVSMGFFMDALPTGSSDYYVCGFLNGSNVLIGTVTVSTTGAIEFRIGNSPASTVAGVTTGPVLVAGSWQHIEIGILRDAAVGTLEVRVDGVAVLNLAALALGADDIAQIRSAGVYLGSGSSPIYQDDLIVRNELGTTNNTFMGDLRVATLQPVANGVNQGWATRAIQKLSTGVMSFLDSNDDMGIAYADDPAFELGSGDFCMEGFVRWDTTLDPDGFHTIFSKWRESTDERSWRLRLRGANLGGDLVWETSTDGTSGDVVEVISYPFVQVTDRYYHFAVAREGGVLRFFIGGVQVGVDTADVRVYENNASALFINGSQLTTNTTVDGESVDGWMDGVRLTVGAARYTANFTVPTDALPDNIGDDPLFASVELLLNFDSTLNPDESGNAFSGTLMNGADVLFPADSSAYQTILSLDPDDNDFVEASLVPATGVLTLTGQPLNAETVVLGATTYTFQTVLVDVADNVLIGATTQDSLDNLRAAVNLEAGAGTLYGTGTVANLSAALSDLPGLQSLATALAAGAVGNTITSTETLTNGSWAAATLLGGLDIPTNSEFTVGALPPEVTGIRSVAIVGRSFKTDGGASELTMSYVHNDASVAAGTANALGLSPVYYEDTFEQDPSTLGNLTPASVLNARIRLDRTL